jgi:high-affinity Fe2+/Pb2+ permease
MCFRLSRHTNFSLYPFTEDPFLRDACSHLNFNCERQKWSRVRESRSSFDSMIRIPWSLFKCCRDLDCEFCVSFTIMLFYINAIYCRFYGSIHGILCLILCLFGILFNCLHVIVLTRQNMRNSAVNIVMCFIALADIGTMASYLIYLLHFVLNNQFSNGW